MSSQPADYQTSSVKPLDTAATRRRGQCHDATLGWNALGNRRPAPLSTAETDLALRHEALCRPALQVHRRRGALFSALFFPLHRRRRFPRSRSACRRRVPHCNPMVHVGGGLQDKAANGRGRRAIDGPASLLASKQYISVRDRLSNALCAKDVRVSASLAGVCTARSLLHVVLQFSPKM